MKNTFDNATYVDVRTPGEFEEKHYPGAVNIPLDQVSSRIDEFRQMKQPIVAYCRSGNRSGMAASILQQNGLPEVYNGGGLDELLHQQKNQA